MDPHELTDSAGLGAAGAVHSDDVALYGSAATDPESDEPKDSDVQYFEELLRRFDRNNGNRRWWKFWTW